MTALATADQVRAIQTARRRRGLDEPAYRAALSGFGVASCKALTVLQAGAFLDGLNGGGSASKGSGRPASRRAVGPSAKILQALWIAGWNLGAVRDPDDVAMMHFVDRQTGIPHTRFLVDPKDAERAIEAIKGWLAREAGVAWPKRKGPGSIEMKRAVVAAIYARLAALGIYPDLAPFDRLAPRELDALAKRLGTTLRAALATASTTEG